MFFLIFFFFFKDFSQRFSVFKFTSHGTILHLLFSKAICHALKFNEGMIISSFFFKFKLFKIRSNAIPLFVNAIAYFEPQYLAIFFSNISTSIGLVPKPT